MRIELSVLLYVHRKRGPIIIGPAMTETVGLLGTGAQDGHLDFHTAPTRRSMRDYMLLKCCFRSTETVGLLGTGTQDGHLDFHTAPTGALRDCRLLKCCFRSTETIGLLGTGAQDVHLDFHTALSSFVVLYVHRNHRLIRDGEPRTSTSTDFHTAPELCGAMR